jgi:hypothetical protein
MNAYYKRKKEWTDMWKSKKFMIIPVVAAVVVLSGATAGIVFAADEQQPALQERGQAKILERTAEILGIDQEELASAFKQAAKEAAEEKFDQRMAKLVEEGKLTQEQVEEYKQWLQDRPDIPFPGGSRNSSFGDAPFRGSMN